jgi:phosphate acetyltransferase
MNKLFIDEFLDLNLKKIQETSPLRVVFPEGSNQKIQEVAKRIVVFYGGKIIPILVFSAQEEIPKTILEVKGIKKIKVSDLDFSDFLFEIFSKRYQGRKEISLSECKELSSQRNYFSVLFLKKKYADCLVGGISYSSRKIISPALQIIGTDKTSQNANMIASSSILLEGKNGERFLVSDPALFSKEPTVTDLFEIGKNAYFASDVFGFKTKKMVFLSYSTFNVLKQRGSGAGKKVEVARGATAMMQSKNFTDLIVYGEMQFDAA